MANPSDVLTSLANLIKGGEATAVADLLDATAAAVPTSLTDPGQQASFLLSFQAGLAQFVAEQGKIVAALGTTAPGGIKTLLQNAAAALRAAAAKA